ncbi:hypothetical protein G647_07217 [Cladophialophora carrionii CBS 160.54]|uniref:Uncharacterized protein n=1 Tax=Cladophialophora carrionii CBS 160.54 TaxID=1279043 RepID=V9D1U3_9EURO|nr:uncharacterized protein G647_07217 [Cladophialophora carrionii CBS 160.54]ETI20874.1 hypothetical protein G647_07217 [Cladophialophora carrionii CBS 160.54]
MSQTSQVLTFRPSPSDPNVTLIERTNYDPNYPQAYTTTPLFSISSQKSSKEVHIYRIGAGNHAIHPTLISSSKYSSLKSATEISLAAGQSIKLTSSGAGDGYKFTCPPLGRMKWKSKTSGALLLQDENRIQLARYESQSGFKGVTAAKFEILVPADDYLLDVIVVTGMAAVKMQGKDKTALEVAAEVVGGVVGSG